jgi:nitrite reductase/ring-hydroxylating ferredoxin subunit
MSVVDGLERAESIDPAVSAGQRVVGVVPKGRARDVLHGVWLGHPLHPALVQGAIGALLSGSILGLTSRGEAAARRLTGLGLIASIPSVASGAVDWADQHEQQMRVGVVHALANTTAIGLYGSSLLSGSPRVSRLLRLTGLAALGAASFLGGHLSFRLASGANHAEAVPHLVKPGWHHLMTDTDLPEGQPVRQMVGEVPVVAVRAGGEVHVLADRCSHLSGPLSDGDLADGCLTCPWHGSTFRITDGSVARGPATAPQPVFQSRVADGAIQVRLPGAG